MYKKLQKPDLVSCIVCSSFSLTGVKSFESKQHGAIRQAELFIFCREGDNTWKKVRRRSKVIPKHRKLAAMHSKNHNFIYTFCANMLFCIIRLHATSKSTTGHITIMKWKFCTNRLETIQGDLTSFFFYSKRNMSNAGDISEPLRKRSSTTEEIGKVVCDLNAKCMGYTVRFFYSSKLRHQI
jgi:hypothetical protein